jgi:hypothetical protein
MAFDGSPWAICRLHRRCRLRSCCCLAFIIRSPTADELGDQSRAVRKEVVGIDGATGKHVDTVVKMGWCAPGVAGIADVADDLAAANKTALSERPESLEVCKVVDLGPRAEDFDDIATKPVPANVEDDTRNRGDDLSAALGEDVNALVSPAAAARSTPGICECFGRYPTNRDGLGGGGW